MPADRPRLRSTTVSIALGQVYKFIDGTGKTTYSDAPRDSASKPAHVSGVALTRYRDDGRIELDNDACRAGVARGRAGPEERAYPYSRTLTPFRAKLGVRSPGRVTYG